MSFRRKPVYITGMFTISSDVEYVFQAVQKALNHSYAPYSKLHVAAGFKVVGQAEPITGCNVENVSFGATICAERAGVCRAVSTLGKPEFEFLVLASTSPQGVIPPCGMCLQVLKEFVGPDFSIYLADSQAVRKKVLFKELFPYTFDPSMLPPG